MTLNQKINNSDNSDTDETLLYFCILIFMILLFIL